MLSNAFWINKIDPAIEVAKTTGLRVGDCFKLTPEKAYFECRILGFDSGEIPIVEYYVVRYYVDYVYDDEDDMFRKGDVYCYPYHIDKDELIDNKYKNENDGSDTWFK